MSIHCCLDGVPTGWLECRQSHGAFFGRLACAPLRLLWQVWVPLAPSRISDDLVLLT